MRILSLAGLVFAAVAVFAAPAPAAPTLSRADREAIDATVDGFVAHAVRRHDVGKAYALASPALRDGMSRSEWVHGDLPVYPYPARGRTFPWTLDYVEPGEVGISLLLQPRRGAKIGPIVFDVRLKRIRGEWLVESLIPAATFAPAGRPAKVRALPDFSPQPQSGGGSNDPSRLSHAYAIIPFALLGLLLAGLAGWGLAHWYRDRRLLPAETRPLSIPAHDARARPSNRS